MKRFRNILASVDTRREMNPALDCAAHLAEQNRASLKLVDVVPDFSWPVRLALPDYAHARELLLQAKREQLEALAAPIRDKGLDVKTAVFSGKTSVAIIREVIRAEHDLVVRVVKGAESPYESFFGSTTTRLLRNCPCAVWAIKSQEEPRFHKILAAIDPEPLDEEHAQLNRNVMELAGSLAEMQGGEFHVVHVWSLFGESALASHLPPEDFEAVQARAQTSVNDAMDRFLAAFQLRVGDAQVHLLKGEPSRTITEFVRANDFDLLVMGTIGRSGMSALVMGNTAEMIFDRVQCAVLALKPQSFLSPVTLE
jgi:universal stress protein E